MDILLTNDDGPFAPGLPALRRALAQMGTVRVVCPARERSGVAHGITYMVPVRAHAVRLADGEQATVLTGTPADCVKFALLELLDAPPDLLVSGPNIGVNVGQDIFYSGTVAAALEGAFYGLRSVAVSCSRQDAGQMDLAARQAVRALRALPTDGPPGRAYNVNIPALDGDQPDISFTAQSTVFPRGRYSSMQDAHGRTHYWLDSTAEDDPPPAGSDVEALRRGAISVTPLWPDLTDRSALESMRTGEQGG
ncbi:MAG: 5'/3'-nucleotidase SurE [Candidatus Brocadiia bacterium]